MSTLRIWFKLSSLFALAGWAIIFILPTWVHAESVIRYGVIGLLSICYAVLLFGARALDTEPVRGSFTSFDGVMKLFKSPRIILVGWVHFLAFDLMVALWIRADASNAAISHFWLLPVYVLTLMFGPAGLLLYFLLKPILI